MIEVILREDVTSLGKAGALVRVKPGYARNFLLPKGLAYEATEGNKKRIAAETRSRTAHAQAEKTQAEELATVLGAVNMQMTAKAGEGDRLFGSITSQDIAEALEARGHTVDRRKIELEYPIKELGEHHVPIRLHAEVVPSITVTVVPE